MILTPSHERDLQRWYALNTHPIQEAFVTDDVRFKIGAAGRRSGKTERAKRYLVREAFKNPGRPYFAGAPTRAQAKQIFWNDLQALSLGSALNERAINVSELTIRLPNQSSLTVLGLDQPQRFEGVFWAGGVLDEMADMKEDTWPVHVSPALDTFDPRFPDYRPWCMMIGVPAGLNQFYDIAEYAKNSGDPDWKFYTWPSSDILPPDVVEAARRRMSKTQFRQEYEASFETAAGRIYDDYSKENYTTEVIQPHEQLHWFHDFNYTPLSSGVGVRRNEGNDFYILDEIILTSAVARQSALEFVDRYKNHKNRKLLLFGDPSGKAGEKHGHPSDYTEMEAVLRQNGWQVERQIRTAAPAIKDRQNAVRAKIQNAHNQVSLYLNITNAPYCHKGLATVQTKKGSTFLEQDGEYQHITTAIGYCIERIWPIAAEKIVLPVKHVPTMNYYRRDK